MLRAPLPYGRVPTELPGMSRLCNVGQGTGLFDPECAASSRAGLLHHGVAYRNPAVGGDARIGYHHRRHTDPLDILLVLLLHSHLHAHRAIHDGWLEEGSRNKELRNG